MKDSYFWQHGWNCSIGFGEINQALKGKCHMSSHQNSLWPKVESRMVVASGQEEWGQGMGKGDHCN
jgi:hypothetical protein